MYSSWIGVEENRWGRRYRDRRYERFGMKWRRSGRWQKEEGNM
jgi:hypothetical protein